MGGSLPEHFFEAVTAKSMAETMEMRAAVFSSAMADSATGQYFPEIGGDCSYRIAPVSPSACKKVIFCMVDRVYLPGIPGKIFSNGITERHIPVFMIFCIPDMKNFSLKINIGHLQVKRLRNP